MVFLGVTQLRHGVATSPQLRGPPVSSFCDLRNTLCGGGSPELRGTQHHSRTSQSLVRCLRQLIPMGAV